MFTTRFELNILNKKQNPVDVVDFAARYNCPAVVTVPELVAPFITARSIRNAVFKVIVMVDLPNGGNFAMQKLRDLGPDALAADGFDIITSPRKNPIESHKEVKLLKEFLNSMNPLAEIRWSLSMFDRPESEYTEYIGAIQQTPCSFLRTDHRTSYPGVTLDSHKKMVESIRKHTATPIKISGNIDKTVYTAFESDKSIRFDITVDQAHNLIRNQNSNEQKTQETEQAKTESQQATNSQEIGTLGRDVE